MGGVTARALHVVRAACVVVLVVLPLAGCSSSHGNSPGLLTTTPDPSSRGPVAYDNQPLTGCDPLPDDSAGTALSDLRFAGPCSFTETAPVQCVDKVDDYYAYVTRQLPDYGQLSALINVERYKGPGTYTKNSVVFLQVSRNGTLYEWKQEAATLTVADKGTKVVVDAASVPAVPGNPARGSARVQGTLACRK